MTDVFVSPDEKPQISNPPVLPEKPPTTEAQRSSVEGHSHNRFSAFNLYPDRVDFESREDQEKIILMLRQHPIVNARWIIISLLLLTGPAILTKIGLISLLPAGYPFVLSLAWFLVTFTYALEGFLGWYFNVYFVTNQRIVDVDFFNLIDKRVSDAEISKIQDATYETIGTLGASLNYGNVTIQTAAEVPEFDFELVPNPEKVIKILDDLRVKGKQESL